MLASLNLSLSQGSVAAHSRWGGGNIMHSTFPQKSYGEKILQINSHLIKVIMKHQV